MTFANAKKLHNEDDGTFKESTPEELEKSWQDLCRRIREEYGEDAI